MDAVILVGGLGIRLRPLLINKPKCLMSINGKPFIDILLDYCIDQGLRRFILCVCYRKEQVIEHLRNRNDCKIIFSEEDKPLGTGGAIKNAELNIENNEFLVFNGDSFIDFSIKDLIAKKNDHFGSMLLCENNNLEHFGHVKVDSSGFVSFFQEKAVFQKFGLINTGRYCFNRKIMEYIPKSKKFSMEYDLLPVLIKNEKIVADEVRSKCIDIGTPDRILDAEIYFKHFSKNS